MITGSSEGSVNVWEVATGRELETLEDFKDESVKSVTLVSFSSDDRQIIVGAGSRDAGFSSAKPTISPFISDKT